MVEYHFSQNAARTWRQQKTFSSTLMGRTSSVQDSMLWWQSRFISASSMLEINVDGHKMSSVIRLLDTIPAIQQFCMQRALKLGPLGFEKLARSIELTTTDRISRGCLQTFPRWILGRFDAGTSWIAGYNWRCRGVGAGCVSVCDWNQLPSCDVHILGRLLGPIPKQMQW